MSRLILEKLEKSWEDKSWKKHSTLAAEGRKADPQVETRKELVPRR
jgi:hypothetical protein